MHTQSLATVITAVAMGGLDHPPTCLFAPIRGGSSLTTKLEVLQAWRDNKTFGSGGLCLPITRKQIEERWPDLKAVNCEWHEGRYGGSFQLHMEGPLVRRNATCVGDGHFATMAQAVDFIESHWQRNGQFQLLGGETLTAQEIAALPDSSTLFSVAVFCRDDRSFRWGDGSAWVAIDIASGRRFR
ncbi:MAG: hypothetical protein JSS86_11315 [Cyanobacteria bacterium SZAS LIN-2]|nr:hypothetical protein [Cyanobacteria bacterium SZAS LIN-2]